MSIVPPAPSALLRSPLLRVAAVVLVAILCIGYSRAAASGMEGFVDQIINRQTVEHMRHGEGYYDAMDRALRDNNGPAGSVRAFRPPTIFLVWRVLPSEAAVWLTFVVFMGIAALLLVVDSDVPLLAPVVAAYLLTLARPRHVDGWIDQYLIVEFWVLPFIGGALVAWRRRRWWLAAALLLVATAIREHVVLLLVGGLLSAHLNRRPRAPWLTALLLAGLGLVAHAALVRPHLVAHGTEAALVGTGGVHALLTMAAIHLPHKALAVPLLYGLAAWRVATEPALGEFLGPYLALPAVAVVVGRDYWGVLVVPLVLVLATEGFIRLVVRVSSARSRRGPVTSPT